MGSVTKFSRNRNSRQLEMKSLKLHDNLFLSFSWLIDILQPELISSFFFFSPAPPPTHTSRASVVLFSPKQFPTFQPSLLTALFLHYLWWHLDLHRWAMPSPVEGMQSRRGAWRNAHALSDGFGLSWGLPLLLLKPLGKNDRTNTKNCLRKLLTRINVRPSLIRQIMTKFYLLDSLAF